MRHFCTYFDSNYLLRGITLYRSLAEHCKKPFRFYALCLDEDAFNALTKLGEENIVPIELENVEQWDNELLAAKGNRSRIEYYFTLSPILPLYVLEHFDVDIVTYLDADLMFFSGPDPIYEELGDASIFVTEHRFSEKLKESIKYGRFNVQCQAFRNDETGLKCLRRWRKQCLEWCYDRLENGKFADQKYLEEWPELYGDSLVISQHPGIGVAPWNILSLAIRSQEGDITVDSKPLVFYHFAGFSLVSRFWLITGAASGVHVRQHAPLFRRYASAMQETHAMLQNHGVATCMYGKTRYVAKRWKSLTLALLRGGLLRAPFTSVSA